MSLWPEQKLELTIFGYVRLNFAGEIPNDVTRLCLKYYNKIEIIWDVFCDKLAEFVSDDGLEVNLSKKRDKYSTFASSIGWNTGIHSFTLKQLEPEGQHLGIGIISSEDIPNIASNDTDENYFLFTNNKAVNGYSMDYGETYEIANGKDLKTFGSNTFPEWKVVDTNDKVTVVIDCDKWQLTFYVNDIICNKSIDMVKDKIYHPVFTIWDNHIASYRLIETEMDIQTANNIPNKQR